MLTRAGSAAVATALTCLVLAAPAGADVGDWRHCGGIAFAPNTDWGVSQIRAKSTRCKRARRVARAVRGLAALEYRKAGFRCRGTPLPSGAAVSWRCTRRQSRIRFFAS